MIPIGICIWAFYTGHPVIGWLVVLQEFLKIGHELGYWK